MAVRKTNIRVSRLCELSIVMNEKTGAVEMAYKRKIARICVILFTGCLFLIAAGMESRTITYHMLNGTNKIYEETYYLPFGKKVISLEMPGRAESENIRFSGWYYDRELTMLAKQSLELTKDLDLYAGWIEDNPETEFLLPEMHITSDVALENVDRWEYCSCTYTITNATVDDCLSNVAGQFRGRGNSTWKEFEKKSYRIKFEDKQNLFDMGADKDWVLLSNSADYTLMRNELAFELGKIMELDYTSQCQWIQLFYNGEYQGLYLLCEQVETGVNRVNIEYPYEPDEIIISFFLELGGELNGFSLPLVEGARDNWEDYFSCEILYPEAEVLSQNQYEYIDAYMQLINVAILTKNWEELIELVDIQSFADWYLVNEIMLNGDMGWSMFAYKPKGDKLYLGPVWDFDQSCGNSYSGGADYETWYPDTSSQNTWFNTLLEMEEFKELMAERLASKLPEIRNLFDREKEKAIIYKQDIDANFERWPVIGTAAWRIREEIGNFKTYEENVDFLFVWLEHRIDWLEKELSSF